MTRLHLTNVSTRMTTPDLAPATVTWSAVAPCGCDGRWAQTYGHLPTVEVAAHRCREAL